MKRYGNLYPKICEADNIRLAHKKAKRGKRHYREVKMVDADPDRFLGQIRETLAQQRFVNSKYVVFRRVEGGKLREIYKLPYYPDRIIHHCIMNILEPIWKTILIRDTYSSLPGRGIHDGAKRMKLFFKDEVGSRYCLKFDIAKFYPSVNHDILKALIRRKIKCAPTLRLLDHIIDSAPGVPIGNYLSQYFGNLYLSYFDHWAKEVLGAKYYARYCDDIVLLHKSKRWLHLARVKIEKYLMEHLRLEIKNTWQVFPTRTRGVDFLGYRFFGTHTLIRKSIATSFKKTATLVAAGRGGQTKIRALASYYGWLKHGSAKNLWTGHVTDDLRRQAARTAAKGKAALPDPLKPAEATQ